MPAAARPIIAVHGGAGNHTRRLLGEQATRASLDVIEEALSVGWEMLASRGGPVAAVVMAVRVMEESGLLNAGRGATVTEQGTVELSAAVADGADRSLGAVALCRVRNPVLFADRLRREGRHVLMAGDPADRLAEEWGLELAEVSPARHQRVVEDPAGTVGAVALGADGELAAATSTGGIHGQRVGRIGDTPIYGAGTWADSATCAVSATGTGEAFIRAGFAHDVHSQLLYGGASLDGACKEALAAVSRFDGRGGCVAVSADGALAAPFTTAGMLRGWRTADSGAVGLDPGECAMP